MPAIYHTKQVDDTFEGAVTHITESTSPDDVVWHCEEVDENYDGAIFHVKWAEQNFAGPVQRVVGIARVITVIVRGTSPLSLPDAVADGLKYVKAFGGVAQRNVPEGYQELEYIEGNTNTQYINTNIVPNSSMNISAKVQLMSDSETTSTFFFGGRTQSSGGTGVAGMWSPSELIFDWFGSTNADRYSVSATRAVGDVLEYSVNNSLVTIKRNGTVAGTHQFIPTGTSTQPLYVNGMNNGGSVISNNSAKARVYRFTVEGICDLVPAKRLSDNAIGMWDKIRKQFFTNAGTGSFTAGIPVNVLPNGYTQVEYIQSTGTQYIDTGFKPNNNSGFVLDYYANAAEQPRVFMIAQEIGSSSYGFGIVLGRGANIAVYNGKRLPSNYWQCNDFSGTGRYTIEVNKTSASITDSTGTQLSYTFPSDTFQLTYNLCLFTLNNSGTIVETPATIRVYSFRIYDNNVLVRDMIPAIRKSDGAIGMYDLVNSVFYANAGTGTFTAGNVISPSPDKSVDIWCNNGAVKAIRPVEYLESTGTQYIDTGFKPNQDTKTELVAQFLDVSLYSMLFGTRTALSEEVYTVQKTSTGYWALGYNNRALPVGTPTPDTNKHIFLKDKNNQYIDSSLVAGYIYANFQCTYTAGIFGANIGGTETAGSPMRVYSCKIYDNDTLVRDFIPALDTNNIPCMFDKVEGKCYYNAGTGQFIAPYLPAEYERLEYIESTGTQYIDTGYVPDSNTKVETEISIPSGNPQVALLGARNSVNATGRYIYDIFANVTTLQKARFQYSGAGAYSDVESYAQIPSETKVKFTKDKEKNYIDGVEQPSNAVDSFSCQYPMYLFSINTAGTPTVMSSLRIYSCKIYDNGTPVADFVPARRISDGEVGMYDVIRRQFFTNAGTGSFICDSSYTQLEYIQSSGTQYINTGVVGDLNTEYEITVKNNSTYSLGSFAIFGSRTSATQNSIMSTFSKSADSLNMINDFGDYTITRQIPVRTSAEILHKYKITNGKSKRTITDLDTGWTDTVTTTYSGSLTTPTNLYIGYAGSLGGLSNSENLRGNIYGCKIWKNGTLVRDFVPAKRNGDNAIGLYDKVSKKFYTNAGTGVFTAGSVIPTPIDPLPIELMVDGTVEKVGIHSADNKNLFNGVFEQGSLSSGVTAYTNLRIRTPNYLTFPAGTYTVSCASDYQIWVEVNNAGGSWVSTKTITLSATDKVKIGVRNKTNPSTTPISVDEPVNVQIEADSTATAYEPYYDGGLAICENLFAIGTYIDEQELLAGDVIRNVGIKVLNGTEDWTYDSTFTRFILKMTERMPTAPLRTIPLYSTHFPNVHNGEAYVNVPNNTILYASSVQIQIKTTDWNSLSSFQSWLASQYNAGTPVIIVYPLETPTTESLAGQTLNVVEGDNYAEIAEASIDDLELEAKYKKTN